MRGAAQHTLRRVFLKEVGYQVKKILELKNIHKSFPGVLALQGVDFSLNEGEIHALMGENGAGKSTLIKVLTGVYTKDEGQIMLDDKEVHIKSPQDAQHLGISTVYQEITLCPNLSVAENMYIGRSDNIIVNILSAPGLALQFITTKEPDESMIEVAIKSVEGVFDWKGFLEEKFDRS